MMHMLINPGKGQQKVVEVVLTENQAIQEESTKGEELKRRFEAREAAIDYRH